MQPTIREHITLLESGAGALKFFCSHRSQIISYAVDAAGERAVGLADGRRTPDEIRSRLDAPHLESRDVEAFFNELAKDGIVRDAAGDAEVPFHTGYEARLRRQLIYLSGLAPADLRGRDLQNRLRTSRVLLIGAGGGGSHLAVQLAGIGVGELVVADPDRVEIENLGRQIFYAGHIGELKVEALKKTLGAMAPETTVTPLYERLSRSSPWLGKALSGVNLVLNCADDPSMGETSRWLFEACYPARIPLIPAGGYNGHMTSLPPTVLPGRSTCWPCYERISMRKASPRVGMLPLSKIKAGIFLPATIAMAALQMPEIVRVLTGYEPPRFTNRRGEFDISSCRLTVEEIPPTPGCGTCEGTA